MRVHFSCYLAARTTVEKQQCRGVVCDKCTCVRVCVFAFWVQVALESCWCRIVSRSPSSGLDDMEGAKKTQPDPTHTHTYRHILEFKLVNKFKGQIRE